MRAGIPGVMRTTFAVALLAGGLMAGCAHNAASLGAVTSPSPGQAEAGGAASPASGDVARGRSIFVENCSMCHGSTGVEGGIGPSLKNERSRKNPEQAIAWIENPQPPMPKLYPSPLSGKDVDDLAAYVESL